MSLKSPFVYVVTQVQMPDLLPSKHILCTLSLCTEYVQYGRTNLHLQHCHSTSASYTLSAFDMPCSSDTSS